MLTYRGQGQGTPRRAPKALTANTAQELLWMCSGEGSLSDTHPLKECLHQLIHPSLAPLTCLCVVWLALYTHLWYMYVCPVPLIGSFTSCPSYLYISYMHTHTLSLSLSPSLLPSPISSIRSVDMRTYWWRP